MVVRPVVCRAFIGRREELAYLHERRLAAGKSHGGLVLVTGDAGIGKSRLLAEFCASLATSRWRVGRGSCLEHAQRPYGPLLDVLAEFGGTPGALTPAATKREQLDAIVARFDRAAAKAGLVAVVEDIHWADAATLESLAFLASNLEHRRVLLLASYRPGELPPGHPSHGGLVKVERAARLGRVEVAPLAGRELRCFIDEALTGFTLPEATRRTVATTSEGNPFFVEELLGLAVERSAANTRTADLSGALPASIRATLLERWDRFAQADRRIVAAAAVIGRTFDISLLAQTLGREIDSVLPALQRARDVQLVDELSATAFRFRHALTREAVYAGFLAAQVRPLHRTIALALESAPEEQRSLEGLAYHWWAAGESERAARYNEAAGDAAGRVHAHDDAITFYTRALESAALDAAARGTLLEKIADRYVALGFSDRSHEQYGAAADAFGAARDVEREARCRVRAAITAYTIGLPAPTAPLGAMLERLAADAFLARSRIHLGIAWLAATFWYPTEAARHLALVDSRALAAGADIALRYHNVASWVAMTVGDLVTFRREHAAWIEAARQAGPVGAIASAHYNGAACYSLFGLHEEASGHIERALEIARSERSRHGEESTHAISAFCYIMSGDLVRARTALAAVSPTTDNHVTIAHAVAWGMQAGEHLGDSALIATWFDDVGVALLDAPEASCGAGFAQILVRRGRMAEARAVLHRAIPDCERPRGNVLTLLAAARYGAPEDSARARAQLVAAANSPTELLERHALALFDAYAEHRHGRHDVARQHAGAAAEGFARLRFPLLEAAARESAGDVSGALAVYHRCGAAGDMRRLLGADVVWDAAKEVPASNGAPASKEAPASNGAPASMGTVSRKAAASQGAPAWNGAAAAKAAPSSGGGLSRREREIAALVAQGNSNVAIARALAISHKTVEKHLGSMFQKLGFSSRSQLAAHVGATARANER